MSGATVLEVELLSGRYHTHVWGEAQFGMAGPEWPPSPWRLLRALASAWFCARPRPSSDEDRDGLLEALGRSGPPQLWLPRSSLHEVRYYQPVRLGASDRALHHDHYAVPEDGRFWFRFNVDLPVDQRTLLAELLARLRYLGRSESRARLRLADCPEPPRGVRPVVPRNGVQSVANVAYPRILCTGPDFRAADLWSVRGGGDTAGEDGHPPHLVDTLLGKRMPVPCGARWIEYAVPTAILVHEIPPRVAPSIPAPDVAVAEIRFRLNRRVPIPIRYLIVVARAFREAAVKEHRGHSESGQVSRTLTGREADGSLARGHEHAYYLPRLQSGGLTIDTIAVRVPTGRVTRAEFDALLSIRRIQVSGRTYPITVVSEAIFPAAGSSMAARRWVSSTPFLPPLRHRRGRHETCVEEQAAASVERLYGRPPASVKKVPGPGGLASASSILAHEYFGDDLTRSGPRWAFTRRLGFWLELTFEKPVCIAAPIGSDAHFGAGQFIST
jgi:CRISPR-associated protein Csb2